MQRVILWGYSYQAHNTFGHKLKGCTQCLNILLSHRGVIWTRKEQKMASGSPFFCFHLWMRHRYRVSKSLIGVLRNSLPRTVLWRNAVSLSICNLAALYKRGSLRYPFGDRIDQETYEHFARLAEPCFMELQWVASLKLWQYLVQCITTPGFKTKTLSFYVQETAFILCWNK